MMDRDNIKNDLTDIFRDIFDDDTLEINDHTSAKDIEDWDSLAQMSLVIAIEKHFKVHFQVDEIQALKNVGEMINLIAEQVED